MFSFYVKCVQVLHIIKTFQIHVWYLAHVVNYYPSRK